MKKKYRRLDGQGRIILPAFIREEMELQKDSEVSIELLENGSIVIAPAKEHCCVCRYEIEGQKVTVHTGDGDRHVCARCARKIKEA